MNAELRQHTWKKTSDAKPPQNFAVETKIHDDKGERNQCVLSLRGDLWFFEDGSMYVYYTPTHWREIQR